MKLRNKKTGEIKSIEEIIRDAFLYNKLDSLKSIDANWEDVDGTNDTNIPIIKDEKVRKAVRAWAEANDIDRVWHECATCWLRGNGLEIFFEELELEQGNYTIAELCGEEEE